MIAALAVGILLALLIGVGATVAWAHFSTRMSERARQELARREDERRLQRLTHLAMAQMLLEARRGQRERR